MITCSWVVGKEQFALRRNLFLFPFEQKHMLLPQTVRYEKNKKNKEEENWVKLLNRVTSMHMQALAQKVSIWAQFTLKKSSKQWECQKNVATETSTTTTTLIIPWPLIVPTEVKTAIHKPPMYVAYHSNRTVANFGFELEYFSKYKKR